jgi:hypothetical protein
MGMPAPVQSLSNIFAQDLPIIRNPDIEIQI